MIEGLKETMLQRKKSVPVFSLQEVPQENENNAQQQSRPSISARVSISPRLLRHTRFASNISRKMSAPAMEFKKVQLTHQWSSPSGSVNLSTSGANPQTNQGVALGLMSGCKTLAGAVGADGMFDDSLENNHVVEDYVDEGTSLRSTSSGADAGSGTEPERARLLRKIEALKDKLSRESTAREHDVDEFVGLTKHHSASNDNPQLIRIKQVFDKRNKEHNAKMHQLQSKLELCCGRLNELDGGSPRMDARRTTPRSDVLTNVGQGLKGMGANLKETITDYTGGVFGNIREGVSAITNVSQNAAGSVISAPRELAHRIKHKFGSADNIPQLAKVNELYSPTVRATFYTDLDDNRTRAYSAENASEGDHRNLRSRNSDIRLQNLERSRSPPQVVPALNLDPLYAKIEALDNKIDTLTDSVIEIRTQSQTEYAYFHGLLHEEKFRYQRLEDQMNDTMELHQAEVLNLKQEMQAMSARLEYQLQERFRDLYDLVENNQNRVARLESSQIQPHLNPEGLNALGLRAMNILVLVLQFVLISMSLAYQMISPLIKSRSRTVFTVVCFMVLLVLWRMKLFDEMTDRFTRHYRH